MMVECPWKLYDVEVEGYGKHTFTAPTRGRAVARAFRTGAFDHLDFRQFLDIARAKVRREPPEDYYGYVRRAYGVEVLIGQRCRLRNEGQKWNGREGTVLYPEGATAHVHVLMDGMGERMIVHPNNVEIQDVRQAT